MSQPQPPYHLLQFVLVLLFIYLFFFFLRINARILFKEVISLYKARQHQRSAMLKLYKLQSYLFTYQKLATICKVTSRNAKEKQDYLTITQDKLP